jgi:hypothetical protein
MSRNTADPTPDPTADPTPDPTADPTADPAPKPPSPPQSDRDYDRDAIFRADGPFDPDFTHEAIRTLMRTLPLDPAEPEAWHNRRMYGALLGVSALHPRDEIEIMLGVQAMSAYHAAAACWRLGMNHHLPNGDSTRHITTAATAARAFDTLLRAIERRQVKPLGIPVGRPTPRTWPRRDVTGFLHDITERCARGADGFDHDAAPPATLDWTETDCARADAFLETERIAKQNEGLDIANTKGILPGGGMIVPDDPTPEQAAYLARRMGEMYRDKFAADLANGIYRIPPIQPVRPGDLIP